jgi:hypothetical protein
MSEERKPFAIDLTVPYDDPNAFRYIEGSPTIPDPNYQDVNDFESLRTEAYVDAYHRLKHRLDTDPTPTPAEISAGSLLEEMEPQMGEAVLAARAKGYNTQSSGFYGGATQGLDGPFQVDEATAALLSQHGIHAVPKPGGWTMISFNATSPDIVGIKATWGKIIDMLPDLGHPAPNSMSAHGAGMRAMMQAHSGKLPPEYLHAWLESIGAGAGYHPKLANAYHGYAR